MIFDLPEIFRIQFLRSLNFNSRLVLQVCLSPAIKSEKKIQLHVALRLSSVYACNKIINSNRKEWNLVGDEGCTTEICTT